MMDIIKCSVCRKAFLKTSGNVCNECLEKVEESYKLVRDFLRENEFSDMEDVSEKTEVPMKMIMFLLKEGRIEIGSPDGSSVGGGVLFCEACKKPVRTGRMCADCKRKIATKIDRAVSPKSELPKVEKPTHSVKSSAKMHVDHKK